MSASRQNVVIFVNFSAHDFVGYWDSVPYEFKSGQRMYMEEWKARHFAKHLANRELLRSGFESDTSPKVKSDGTTDNNRFNEYVAKAVIMTDHEVDSSRAVTDALNLNLNGDEEKEESPKAKAKKTKELKKEEKEEVEEDEDDVNIEFKD
jgi:hypothetical protein